LFKEPAPRKGLRLKSKDTPKNECQTAYEPTNAIRCNDSERRRWVRVREWFNDLAATENNNREKEKGHIIELSRS
jgi:hypothetical protein